MRSRLRLRLSTLVACAAVGSLTGRGWRAVLASYAARGGAYERAAMWEAGRAARTERAQAAKRGLSWSGGEGDGDARDEHDECGDYVTSTRTLTPSHKACTDVRSVPASARLAVVVGPPSPAARLGPICDDG